MLIGISNISANNGWSMALVGISIVFTGLVFLSVAVSQLKKLIGFWEGKASFKDDATHGSEEKTLPREMKAILQKFMLLTERLETPFSSSRLVELAKTAGLRQPVDAIDALVEKELLVSNEKGDYRWNESVVNLIDRDA